MIRCQFYAWCVLAGLSGGVVVSSRPAMAQQPQAPARVRVQTAPAAQPGSAQQQGTPPAAGQQAQPRAARPTAEPIQQQLDPELEKLLVAWERESSKITRLRGDIERYTYDHVYNVEKRGVGTFWYQSPDQGRIDFKPSTNTSPSLQKGKQGEAFTVEPEGHQRWICNGKMIYVINDDAKIADQVQIPAHLQGKNITNGPLPFLFGLQAAQAKQRYHLKLGNRHSPQRQIHVVAAPKFEVDAAEWSMAEVLLDPVEFVPTAIRLINPQKTQVTTYTFANLKKNETWLFNNPFNDRPPSNYTIGQPSRATNDQTPVARPN